MLARQGMWPGRECGWQGRLSEGAVLPEISGCRQLSCRRTPSGHTLSRKPTFIAPLQTPPPPRHAQPPSTSPAHPQATQPEPPSSLSSRTHTMALQPRSAYGTDDFFRWGAQGAAAEGARALLQRRRAVGRRRSPPPPSLPPHPLACPPALLLLLPTQTRSPFFSMTGFPDLTRALAPFEGAAGQGSQLTTRGMPLDVVRAL